VIIPENSIILLLYVMKFGGDPMVEKMAILAVDRSVWLDGVHGAPKASPPTIFSHNIDEDVKKKRRRRRKKKGEMSTHF